MESENSDSAITGVDHQVTSNLELTTTMDPLDLKETEATAISSQEEEQASEQQSTTVDSLDQLTPNLDLEILNLEETGSSANHNQEGKETSELQITNIDSFSLEETGALADSSQEKKMVSELHSSPVNTLGTEDTGASANDNQEGDQTSGLQSTTSVHSESPIEGQAGLTSISGPNDTPTSDEEQGFPEFVDGTYSVAPPSIHSQCKQSHPILFA